MLRNSEAKPPTIVDNARDAFAWADGDRRFIAIVATVAIPALLSIVTSVIPNHVEKFTAVTFVLLAVILFALIVQGVAAVRLVKKPETLSGLILRCDELESELKRETEASRLARLTADRLTHLQAWSLGLYTLQSNLGNLDINIDKKPKPTIYDFFESFLAPLHQGPREFFGFGDADRWNICVYLYDQKSDELRPVWRRTDPRHPSASANGGARGKGGFGRNWRPGSGHTGMAFRQERSFITEDIQKSDLQHAFLAAGNAYRDYDPDIYRSFASIPFGDNDGKPIGVLVVTSNCPGAVSETTALPLRHAATVFTNLTKEIVTLQQLLT